MYVFLKVESSEDNSAAINNLLWKDTSQVKLSTRRQPLVGFTHLLGALFCQFPLAITNI